MAWEEKLRSKIQRTSWPTREVAGAALGGVVLVAFIAWLSAGDAITASQEAIVHTGRGDVAITKNITVQQTRPRVTLAWTDYSREERARIRAEIFALSPQMLGKKVEWQPIQKHLNAAYGILHSHPNDLFRYRSSPWPEIAARALKDKQAIKQYLINAPSTTLRKMWGVQPTLLSQRGQQWASLIKPHLIASLGSREKAQQYIDEWLAE